MRIKSWQKNLFTARQEKLELLVKTQWKSDIYMCGKEMPDKVYMVTKFSRKDGTESTKATAICSVKDANELGKLLMQVK